MSKHVVSFELSVSSVENALKELERYSKRFMVAADIFMRELALMGIRKIEDRWASTAGESYNRGHSTGFYEVEETDDRIVFVISITGEHVVFVEFGTGVHYNGHLHGSPHPKGVELGMTIGDYPSENPPSQGRYDGWKSPFGYTHGEEAACAIPAAVNEMRQNLLRVAQEAWRQAG